MEMLRGDFFSLQPRMDRISSFHRDDEVTGLVFACGPETIHFTWLFIKNLFVRKSMCADRLKRKKRVNLLVHSQLTTVPRAEPG